MITEYAQINHFLCKLHQTGTVNNLPHHGTHIALTQETLEQCQVCYLKHHTNHYGEWQKSRISPTVLRIVLHVLYNFILTVFELHANCRHLISIKVYIIVTDFPQILSLCRCNQPD